jgi:tetratricopeptide (TPR) repeat protein
MSISIPTDPGNKWREQVSALWQQVGAIAGTLGAFAIVIAIQTPQLDTLKHQTKSLSKADLQREEAKTKVQLALMKTLPTFGFNNLIADLHFLDFLQYFGDGEVRSQAGYGAAVDYFDVILDRDPWFIMGYYYLSNTASLYAGQPDRSVELMDRGLKSFSPLVPDRGYYIWRMKAVDELLFLGNAPKAKQSMLTAAGWARQNPDEESQRVAQISQATADHLARNPNSKQAQFDAWNMVLSSAVDETAIKRAIAAIRSLGGKVTIGADGQMKVDAPPKD